MSKTLTNTSGTQFTWNTLQDTQHFQHHGARYSQVLKYNTGIVSRSYTHTMTN